MHLAAHSSAAALVCAPPRTPRTNRALAHTMYTHHGHPLPSPPRPRAAYSQFACSLGSCMYAPIDYPQATCSPRLTQPGHNLGRCSRSTAGSLNSWRCGRLQCGRCHRRTSSSSSTRSHVRLACMHVCTHTHTCMQTMPPEDLLKLINQIACAPRMHACMHTHTHMHADDATGGPPQAHQPDRMCIHVYFGCQRAVYSSRATDSAHMHALQPCMHTYAAGPFFKSKPMNHYTMHTCMHTYAAGPFFKSKPMNHYGGSVLSYLAVCGMQVRA